MATVSQIFSASLRKLIAAGNEVSEEDSDAQDYIFALNNWMNEFIGLGYALTWTTVDALDDTLELLNQADTPVDVTDESLRALTAIIAVEVAPEYGATVDAALAQAAAQGKRALAKLGRGDVDMHYPQTLPRGSGNDERYLLDEAFYNGNE